MNSCGLEYYTTQYNHVLSKTLNHLKREDWSGIFIRIISHVSHTGQNGHVQKNRVVLPTLSWHKKTKDSLDAYRQ